MEERRDESKEVDSNIVHMHEEQVLLHLEEEVADQLVLLVEELVEELLDHPLVNNPRRPGIAGHFPVSSLCLKVCKLFCIFNLFFKMFLQVR